MTAHHLSGGEISGYAAAIILVLGSIGAGCKWLLGWSDRRRDSLYQNNLAWQKRLQAREDAFGAEQQSHFLRIETRLARAEQQVEAVLNAYHLIAGELRAKDPDNLKLGMAEEILKAAWRIEALVPAEMKATLAKIDAGREA